MVPAIWENYIQVSGTLTESMYNKIPSVVCEKDSVVQVTSHI